MLIAVFFAVFALAIVYSTIGTAETLFLREHLQDASDRAALSDAVMNARSMNLLVLINIVMAALLAVLVTLKLVEALTIIGMAIASAMAWLFPAALAAVPPLKVIQSAMQSAYGALQPPVYEALQALHAAATAVQGEGPGAADAVAGADVVAKPVTAGFVASAASALPVEDDSFKELCGRAAEVPVELAKIPLGPVGGVLDWVEGFMHDLASSFSDWFCGDPGSDPPSRNERLKIAYPRMSWNVACEADKPDVPFDPSVPVLDKPPSPKCLEAKLKNDQAAPDDQTGECRPEFDCSLGSPYDQLVVQARIQCEPSGKPAPFVYKVQQRKGHVTYTWQGKLWKRGDPRYETPVAVSLNEAPCVTWSRSGGIARKYNPVVRTTRDVDDVEPVCSDEAPPPVSIRSASANGETVDVDFTEIRHVLGCQKWEDVPVKVSDDKAGGDGGPSRSPKRIRDKTDLGSESFQIRSVTQGDLDAQGARSIVGLALWSQTAPDEPFPNLRALAGYGTAQAEYFFDGTGKSTEWMWEMNWRARLRRFRVPQQSASETFLRKCSAALGANECASLTEKLEDTGPGSH